LRYTISVGADAGIVYVIAQKDLELVGAYTAYSSLISLAIGLLYGSVFPLTTLMAAAKHEENEAVENNDALAALVAREKIRQIWRQGIIFALMLCLPAVAFGLTASPIFEALHQPEVVLKDSLKYLMYSAPGFVVDLLYRITARTVSGLGVKKSILVADTFDRFLEIGLSYAFMNGKFGLPELGLPGVAAAYSVSKAVTLLAHALYMYTSPECFGFDYKKYNLFACDGAFFDKAVFKKLLSMGLPSGLESVLSAVSGILVTMLCGQFGTAPLVGVQVANLYSGFANFHCSAALNIAAKSIGQYSEVLRNEEGKFSASAIERASHNAKMYLKILYGVCISISAIACALTFLIPLQLASLLIDKNNLGHQPHLRTAMDFLKIQGVFQAVQGVQLPSYCGLYGLGANTLLLWTTIIFELAMNAGAAATVRFGMDKDANWVFASTGLGLASMALVQLWFVNQKIKGVRPDAARVEVVEDANANSTSVIVPVQAQSEPERSCYQRLMFWSSEKKEEVNLADAQRSLLAAC
jgi:MATE family multidrug resistance protein